MYYVYRHIRLDKNVPFYIGMGKENLSPQSKTSAGSFRRANQNGKRYKQVVNAPTIHFYR